MICCPKNDLKNACRNNKDDLCSQKVDNGMHSSNIHYVIHATKSLTNLSLVFAFLLVQKGAGL